MPLKSVLGSVALTFYGIGVIIGASVYSVIGAAAGMAGEALWLSFVLAAIVALPTALSYAEMTTLFPEAGAEYTYLRKAFPRANWVASLTGFLILLGGSASAATVAMGFGGYLSVFVGLSPVLSAFILTAACTLLVMIGPQLSSGVNIAFTLIEILGLALVIGAGFAKGDMLAPLAAPLDTDIASAGALLFFVYLGFEELANLAEEAHEPGRTLPRAILWSLAITTGLYVLIALAAVSLVPPDTLASSEAPLVSALTTFWPGGASTLWAIALFATANTVLITLIATSRLAFSMSRSDILPAFAGRLSGKNERLIWATLMAGVIAAAFLPIGELKMLAELSSLTALLAFLTVNLTVIVLRYRQPQARRPFKVPLTIGKLPVIPVLAIALVLMLLSFFEWRVHAIALGLLLAIGVVMMIQAGLRRHGGTGG
jgi:amino acid transporter